jgi:hypothetical protein
MLYSLNHIKTLNIFGQCYITEDILIDFLRSEACMGLESLCVNLIPLTKKFLYALIDELYPNNIRRISVADCKIRNEDILEWLEFLTTFSVKRFESIHCSHYIDHPLVALSDGWYLFFLF